MVASLAMARASSGESCWALAGAAFTAQATAMKMKTRRRQFPTAVWALQHAATARAALPVFTLDTMTSRILLRPSASFFPPRLPSNYGASGKGGRLAKRDVQAKPSSPNGNAARAQAATLRPRREAGTGVSSGAGTRDDTPSSKAPAVLQVSPQSPYRARCLGRRLGL